MMILFIAVIGTILAIALWALYDFDFDEMIYQEEEK